MVGKIEDKSYLYALASVLERHFPDSDYSLNGYQESSVCIQFEDDAWMIYIGERGNHYEEIKCNTPLQACVEFLHRMTHTKDEVSLLESELIENLSKSNTY